MDILIRQLKTEDAVFINEMRGQKGVYENTLGLPSERLSKTQAFVNNLSENDYAYVAEIEDGEKKVIGLTSLSVFKNPRMKHAGTMGIMVHKDYQEKGIGKKLMNAVVDLADNWLMLKRIELGVYTDNEKAMNLYKSFGFEIEGCKKYSAVRNGVFVDEYIMARYNIVE